MIPRGGIEQFDETTKIHCADRLVGKSISGRLLPVTSAAYAPLVPFYLVSLEYVRFSNAFFECRKTTDHLFSDLRVPRAGTDSNVETGTDIDIDTSTDKLWKGREYGPCYHKYCCACWQQCFEPHDFMAQATDGIDELVAALEARNRELSQRLEGYERNPPMRLRHTAD